MRGDEPAQAAADQIIFVFNLAPNDAIVIKMGERGVGDMRHLKIPTEKFEFLK